MISSTTAQTRRARSIGFITASILPPSRNPCPPRSPRRRMASTWVELGRTASSSGPTVQIATPRLPAVSDDGRRVLLPIYGDTSAVLPTLRLAIIRVADEAESASFPILTEADGARAIEFAEGGRAGALDRGGQREGTRAHRLHRARARGDLVAFALGLLD
jgi:hypothetical protein